jgi:hypothetical protein
MLSCDAGEYRGFQADFPEVPTPTEPVAVSTGRLDATTMAAVVGTAAMASNQPANSLRLCSTGNRSYWCVPGSDTEPSALTRTE